MNEKLKTISATIAKKETVEHKWSKCTYNMYPLYIFNVYTLDTIAVGRSGNPYYPNFATIVCVKGTGNDKRLKEICKYLDTIKMDYGLNPRKQNFWDILLRK